MEPSNHHREKFISMLKDSILTLCKNGLMDDHGITRVEGLLGVTLQNHEVFLINIQEELLPLRDFSRHLNNGEHTEGRRTGLKTSPRMLMTSVSEKRSLNHLTSRYPSNSKHSKITSSAHEDAATCTDDRGGGQRRRDSKTEEQCAVEESIQDASNFDVCGSKNSVAAYRERINNELICLADGSGMEETSETETSEPLELIRRTKDEPDDVIYNLSGSVMGQLQSLESGFNCTSLVNSSSVMHWSSKDPKNLSLPSNLVPYLPSMLHFPGQSVSHSSSLSPPSPNFASHGNMLHPFYTDSGTRQSLGSNQRHSYKLLNRQNKKYCCDMCNYKSNRSYNLVRHVMHVHSSGRFPCPECGLVLHNRMQLRGHQLQHHCSDVAGSVLDMVKLEPEESVNS